MIIYLSISEYCIFNQIYFTEIQLAKIEFKSKI